MKWNEWIELLFSLLEILHCEAYFRLSRQAAKGQAACKSEIESLKAENAKLRRDVEAWKGKLSAAELANGKKVYPHPGQLQQP